MKDINFPKAYVCILILVAWACNSNKDLGEPEFFMIERLCTDGIYEVFVISNPPKDTINLKRLVEDYNINSVPIDTFEKHETINRQFYRETDLLTRDYVRGEPYPNTDKLGWLESLNYIRQDLVNHHDDLIMVTMFTKRYDDSIIYRHCYDYADYGFGMRAKVINLDSIYSKGFGY